MSIFTGAGVALCTPFTQDGVNFDAFGKLIDFQIDGGTDALIVNGTTGEPSTMSEEEKRAALSFALERTAGRIPVIAGTGGNDTKKVIAASIEAQKMGADALLIVTPYYNKATQKGLIAHYTAVADAVDIPIIVYNVPGRTGLNMLPETLAALAEHPNIAGMKEASGNLAQVSEMARLCGDKCDLYSGEDGLVVPLLSVGGKGVISVVSNIAPRIMHDMVEKFLSGDIAGARELQFKVNPLAAALFCEVNPIPAKTALRLIGIDAGPLRLPLTEMSDANLARLKREMQAFGLID
ncbi:4-hydroxy-tetrahydrodipicolinate synthase [Christensenellaceae bacterium NSJ-44]|jgi:4-hydroxy-tetrahydrodipicolinate synthase|uniref:4-hydroxy-tetrahydrodipicolinate synthase n=1 Tax=Luoshenia tenuis TaxID=2763654 RepID=A0A926HLV9_9FIRM|nr:MULTISPECIES: 4-hydroxy-tetrahydrodipicolinate synthase [Clostridia]MBC8528498.1 4-hydroxy-tetrahydrodipicolinate synthase [Luoshenia tenuis]SCJ56658.1 Dihydrodipicolinate synthase [uncultured Clostridium sp.]